LEAAEEIARQLRLRDLGGIIVIDFIDMRDPSHKRELERRMKRALKEDRAKVDVFPISKLGLMEIATQRLRASLLEEAHQVCPHCKGMGWVRTPQSVAVSVLRKIKERVITGGFQEVQLRLSPEVADYLLNNKREELTSIESRFKVKITVKPISDLSYGEYSLEFSKAPLPWYKRIFNRSL
ncbi:MAG: ribonuclease E/G, partial [Deltaproteobacteria bacterium]